MASFFNFDLPDNCKIIAHGDTHIGATAFAEKAFRNNVLKPLRTEKNTFGIHMGDFAEAIDVNHPHFQLDAVKINRPLLQYEYGRDMYAEEKALDSMLMIQTGNHDMRYKKYGDFMRSVFRNDDVEIGSYQNRLDLGNGVKLHTFHGRWNVPSGSPHPIIRQAGLHKWMVDKLSPLDGTSHGHLMGHSHQCHAFKPIDLPERYTLMSRSATDSKVVALSNKQKPVMDDFVDPLDRWYANTGTYRRGGYWGGIDDDYGEVAGFPPLPVSHIEIIIKKGKIADMVKVYPELQRQDDT